MKSFDQCCIIRSVPAGTDGKSRTGMLTGTRHPYVPPRPKSRPVPARSVHFGPFQPVSAGNLVSAGTLFGLWFLVFLLCFESAGPKSNFFFSAFTPPLSSLKSDLSASPLSSDLSSSFKWRHHSRLQASSLCRFAHCFCRLQQSSPAQLQALPIVSAASKVQPPPTGMIFDFFLFFFTVIFLCVLICKFGLWFDYICDCEFLIVNCEFVNWDYCELWLWIVNL